MDDFGLYSMVIVGIQWYPMVFIGIPWVSLVFQVQTDHSVSIYVFSDWERVILERTELARESAVCWVI